MTEHDKPDEASPVGDAPILDGTPIEPAGESASTDLGEDGSILSATGLKLAREAHEWSSAEVASKLRMSERQIAALEAGRWDALPGIAFVRGALRAYGRLLERDVSPLLSTIAAAHNALDLRQSLGARRSLGVGAVGNTYGQPSSASRWGLGLLGLLAVIAIAFIFAPSTDLGPLKAWFDLRKSSEPGQSPDPLPGPAMAGAARAPEEPTAADARPSDEAVAAAAKAASSLLAATSAGSSAKPSAVKPGAGAQSAAQTVAATPPPAPVAAPEPADVERARDASRQAFAGPGAGESSAAPSASGDTSADAAPAPATAKAAQVAAAASAAGGVAGPDSLALSFSGECWVEISGPQGKRIVFGLQKPQTSVSLRAPGPLSIVIGNAGAASLTRGGRSIDLQAAARNGVAKLRLE